MVWSYFVHQSGAEFRSQGHGHGYEQKTPSGWTIVRDPDTIKSIQEDAFQKKSINLRSYPKVPVNVGSLPSSWTILSALKALKKK
jgi:hypothetical protein